MKGVGALVLFTLLGLGIVALGVAAFGMTWLVLRAAVPPRYDEMQTNRKLSDDENDEIILAKLRDSGSDLTKPTDVVFYLYVPTRTDARALAATLEKAGYSAEVDEPLGRLSDGTYSSSYGVVAHIEEVPSMKNLRKDRRLYKGLARRYKGVYDGWEAAVAH